MGVDLELLPIDCDRGEWGYSHTLLQVPRRRELWDAIGALAEGPIPDDFTSYLSRDDAYEEPHYGKTAEDAYGTPLRWARAGELAAVLPECPARAYVAAMDPRAKVALYWH